MSDWTDELKEQAKELYLEMKPTPENSVECVKSVADELEMSPNGVRMILTKMGVYVKKAATSSSSSKASSEDKPKRVRKQDAIDELTGLLEDNNVEVDESIVSKLTGKAAVYFKDVITKILETD